MKTGKWMLLAAVVFSLASCEEKKAGTMETKQVCITDSLAKMVSIDTARASAITNELKLNGEVSFDESKVVKVFPFASGQVTSVKVSLGDKVRKGQVMAIIRSADVAGNYSDLASAQADVAISKRQLQQAEYLYNNGISSERDYIEAKENFKKTQAINKKVTDQIAINGGGNTNAAGMLVVTAPREGYIVEMNIAAGNFIRQDNNSSMFTISDMKDVWVKANVYETDIAKVKPGYVAYVNTLAYPDKTFTGKVDNVSSVLDPDTKVMTVRISLPNNEMLLKPEMFTNVRIVNKEALTAVAIPSKAIIFDNGRNYVIHYKSNCDLQLNEISVIKNVEDTTYVYSGLRAGDKIVSKNQLLLYNALTQN